MSTMKTVDMLTLEGLAKLFKEYGVPASAQVLAAHIEHGNFPFAVAAKTRNGGMHYLIFRAGAVEMLDKWAREEERPVAQ